MAALRKPKTDPLDAIEAKLDEAKSSVDEIWQEEEASYSERSERWQESEKGQTTQERIDLLEQLAGEIETAIDTLNSSPRIKMPADPSARRRSGRRCDRRRRE